MPQGAAFGSQRDRAQTSIGGGGRTSASGGSTGAYNGQGRPNPVAAAFTGPTGLRGPLGPTGDAGHTTATLGAGSDFQGAVSDYANNYTADPLSRAVKALTGVGLRQPNPSIPSTYSHGLAHTNVDPLGVALGAAGMATGVPVGAIYGLGKQITGWEGPQVKLGDASPGAPQPGQGFDYSGAGQQGRFGPGTQQTAMAAFGNPTQGGQTALNAPGGAPFGPQPSAPGAAPAATIGAPSAADPMAALFSPKIANHSLPQGYQSLFPGSLTDQDKALLYGKALMGGAA